MPKAFLSHLYLCHKECISNKIHRKPIDTASLLRPTLIERPNDYTVYIQDSDNMPWSSLLSQHTVHQLERFSRAKETECTIHFGVKRS